MSAKRTTSGRGGLSRLSAQWSEIVSAYRKRHREWTMRVLPTMTDKEWERYLAWVAEFGGTRQRRMKRRLSEVRKLLNTQNVTAAVTKAAVVHIEARDFLASTHTERARLSRMIVHLSEKRDEIIYRALLQGDNMYADATRRGSKNSRRSGRSTS